MKGLTPVGSKLGIRTRNKNEQILANPNTPGEPGKKRAFLGKAGQKTGKKAGDQNQTLAKQGETKIFAEFWFSIATPWLTQASLADVN